MRGRYDERRLRPPARLWLPRQFGIIGSNGLIALLTLGLNNRAHAIEHANTFLKPCCALVAWRIAFADGLDGLTVGFVALPANGRELCCLDAGILLEYA